MTAGRGPSVASLAFAVARRPSLWRGALRMVPPKWWTRRPPLPFPPRDYLRFRIETMYGAEGGLDSGDLIRYLEWCRAVTARSR